MDCITVDSFALLGGDHEQGEAFYGQHLEDGLHLNELGNKRLYEVSWFYVSLFVLNINYAFQHTPFIM
jgi:hypothetical protein